MPARPLRQIVAQLAAAAGPAIAWVGIGQVLLLLSALCDPVTPARAAAHCDAHPSLQRPQLPRGPGAGRGREQRAGGRLWQPRGAAGGDGGGGEHGRGQRVEGV